MSKDNVTPGARVPDAVTASPHVPAQERFEPGCTDAASSQAVSLRRIADTLIAIHSLIPKDEG